MSWDDEEDLNIVHIPPSIEHEPTLPVTQPTSTAFDDDDKDADVLGVDEEVVIKKRRVMVKLDEDKLMSARGIPYLQAKAKTKLFPHLKKDKGNELRNLNKILQFYQLWAHGLYPRANFQDFIQMARSTGKRPRMKMMRQSWIADEKSAGLGVNALHEEVIETGQEPSVPVIADLPETGFNQNPDSLFVGDVDEDDFMDDLDHDEETPMRTSASAVSDPTPSTSAPPRSGNPFVVDDDDDDGLYDMPPGFGLRSKSPNDAELDELLTGVPPKPTEYIPDDDELDELLRKAPSTRVTSVLEDEDDVELDRLMDDAGHHASSTSVLKSSKGDADTMELENQSSASIPDQLAPPSEHVEDFEQEAFDSVQDLGF